ncbi:MAG: hypothetical protein IJI97_05920 [Clostridia bacterium]|nr:hypothetical protein [Clostridia bacterium]
MKVYKGTNGRKERIAWIEPRIMLQLEIHELIDGLCSRYVRNRGDEDGPLPESLTADEIVSAVKEEYAYYGTNAVWTWGEESGHDENEAREWARGLILAVFPELEVTP